MIALVDEDGDVVESYEYEPYGMPTVSTVAGDAVTTGRASSVGNRFLFSGREWDADLEMYHFRYRTYSPRDRRFMQDDPIGLGGGWNVYAYCGGNPVMLIDPYGLEEPTPIPTPQPQPDPSPAEPIDVDVVCMQKGDDAYPSGGLAGEVLQARDGWEFEARMDEADSITSPGSRVRVHAHGGGEGILRMMQDSSFTIHQWATDPTKSFSFDNVTIEFRACFSGDVSDKELREIQEALGNGTTIILYQGEWLERPGPFDWGKGKVTVHPDGRIDRPDREGGQGGKPRKKEKQESKKGQKCSRLPVPFWTGS